MADVETAAASKSKLQAALDQARSDADQARERVAESAAAAVVIAEQSAADTATLESLEYLHTKLPSINYEEPIGSSIMPPLDQQRVIENGDGSGGNEVQRLRLGLSEALLQCESTGAELEAARLESQTNEQKYRRLAESHAAVAEAATPRVRSSDDESDDEIEPVEAGGNKRRRVAAPGVVDLVSIVTSLRQERDRSVRVAAGLNRKLSTLMREQRYGQLLHFS